LLRNISKIVCNFPKKPNLSDAVLRAKVTRTFAGFFQSVADLAPQLQSLRPQVQSLRLGAQSLLYRPAFTAYRHHLPLACGYAAKTEN